MSEALAPYSIPEILGLMTGAFIVALLFLIFVFRAVSAMIAMKKYDAVCAQVEILEAKVMEMNSAVAVLEAEFEGRLLEAKQGYERKAFDLQQIIFSRNSEILDLKSKLLEMSKMNLYESNLAQ